MVNLSTSVFLIFCNPFLITNNSVSLPCFRKQVFVSHLVIYFYTYCIYKSLQALL